MQPDWNMEIKMSRVIEVEIHQSPVELYKILKFENFAASGGEAKHMIADGLVRVNGRIETQKRKKIIPGDEIQIEDIVLKIVLQNPKE